MKTLVIGAHGKIGRLFCLAGPDDLAEPATPREPCQVVAMVRDERQLAFFRDRNVEAVLGDLEGEFATAFEGCERVVFSAGSGGHTGGDKTLLVDLFGAIRAIEEAERRDVAHFVMVSAMRVEDPMAAPPAMRHYFVAKKLADERLMASSLPYTILRPGRLVDTQASGRVRTDPAAGTGFDISRANVARCIQAALSSEHSRGRVVDLLDGELRIEELFAR